MGSVAQRLPQQIAAKLDQAADLRRRALLAGERPHEPPGYALKAQVQREQHSQRQHSERGKHPQRQSSRALSHAAHYNGALRIFPRWRLTQNATLAGSDGS